MAGTGDDVPQPWNGQPPTDSPYYAEYERTEGEQADQQADPPWTDDPTHLVVPDGPNRRLLAGLVLAVVVVLVGGVALWWFAAGPGRTDTPRPVAATRDNPQPPERHVPPSASSPSPNIAAAYDVGSCFDEAQGAGPGKVELNLVPCGGNRAVFVINKIVTTAAACDSGADFHNHGYEVPDETANVAYCASLVVPANVCFTLAAAQPIERTPCDAAPGTVRVTAVEPAPNATSACTDKQNPDVWYYQSPTSGQFACVSRPPTGSTTAPTTR